MAMLDRNTLLSLNKDRDSIDQHKVALSKMKSVNIAPDAKHDFLADRARRKEITGIDDLYDKLNDLEKNGVLDIWIKKFGKEQYMRGKPLKESIEILEDILIESTKVTFVLNKDSIMEEMDSGAAPGMMLGGAGPITPLGGTPSKNKMIVNNTPEATLTHQDPGAEKRTK